MTVQGQNLVGRFLEFFDWEHMISAAQLKTCHQSLSQLALSKLKLKAGQYCIWETGKFGPNSRLPEALVQSLKPLHNQV